jgi:methylphosphotriester-DNA--protein-cysteine methyltransferase
LVASVLRFTTAITDQSPFRDERRAARIGAVRKRLSETSEALAATPGFSSASHVSASFQAATGEAPAQFRARRKR